MGKASGSLVAICCVNILLLAFLGPLPSLASSPEELLQVGTGAFSDGFYQVAEAQFREFLRSYPQHDLASKVAYLLGKALYRQKKFKEAQKVFASLTMQTDVEELDGAYFWLARTCEEKGDITCARRSFLALIEDYPNSPWYLSSLYSLGKIYFHEGRFKTAEEHFTKALTASDISPSLTSTVEFWFGLTLYNLGRYTEAASHLNNVITSELRDGHFEQALYWLGETRVKLEQYSEAATTFNTFLARFPRSSLVPNALYGASWCLYKTGNLEDAFKQLSVLKNGYPHTRLLPQAMFLMGEIYVATEKYHKAIEVFREFLSRFPKDQLRGQSLLKLGWCYLELRDFTRLKEIAYDIVKLPPGVKEKTLAQYILAELNFYEGKYEEALPYLFNLLNVPDYRQDALFKIATSFFRKQEFKESIVNLDLLQLEYPDFKAMDEALWMKGESYRELGNFPEARKTYEKVVADHEQSPWYPWSIYRVISMNLNADNIEAAKTYFSLLRKGFPNHKVCYEAALRVGISQAGAVKYLPALSYFDIAVQSPDRNIVEKALSWQGAIYFNLKEYQKALACYQQVVEVPHAKGNPVVPLAYLEIGNIKHILGDEKGAIDAYKHAIETSADEDFIDKVQQLLKDLQVTKGGTP